MAIRSSACAQNTRNRIRQLEEAQPGIERSNRGLFSSDYERLSRETLLMERRTILELRNQRVINDDILRIIQHDIDLAEARLAPRRN